MFYTSFLIKEGKAKIFFEETEEGGNKPLIVPLKKRKHGEENSNGIDNKRQVLMKISMEEWIRLKV